MRVISTLVLLPAFLILLAGCAGKALVVEEDLPKQFQERQLLVTLPETLKSQWPTINSALMAKHGLEQTGEFPLSSINVDCLVYKVPPKQNVDAVLKQIEGDKRVVLAQRNQVFEGIQSGESDEYASISYAPKLIHADAAHANATGKNVSIAVVDTGLEKSHPDLKGRLAKTANFVDGGELTFNRDRHGTAVTGVIGARANDGIGIYGIAPDAEISAFKACWYAGESENSALCSSWSLAKAIDAAIQQGVKIINLSLAGPEDLLLTKLLETAHERGITVVAATLEKGDHPGFPASLASVIPVISADTEGNAKAPKWLGELPDVAVAPGVEILSTVPKESYDFLSGSSLASAHISGAIALLLQLNPTLSPDQIKQWVLLSSDKSQSGQLRVFDVCKLLHQANAQIDC